MKKSQLRAIIKKREGKLIAIASTEDPDRSGDVVLVKDWDFSHFLNNPVLQAGHDYRPQYTVGVAKNLRVSGKQVLFEPTFHEITPLARQIKQMYEEGILKAWSVGFIPAGAEESRKKHELLEISAVAVPANQNALMSSMKSMTDVEQKQLENKLKDWQDDVLEAEDTKNVDDEDEVETNEDSEDKSFDEEDHVPDFDVDILKKELVEQSTGESNEHVHLASFDDETGDGTTDVVDDHSHEIINFEVQESDGHTHTLNLATDVDGSEQEAYGTGKPKKRKPKKDIENVPVWYKGIPKAFQKNYDANEYETEIKFIEDELLIKFFDCKIKDVYANTHNIPMPMVGTYLNSIEKNIEGLQINDVRSFDYSKEKMPVYETIQLSLEERKDFLVEGAQFLRKGGKNTFVVKRIPTWTGLSLSIFSHRDNKKETAQLMADIQKYAVENNFLKGQAFSLTGEFLQRHDRTFKQLFVKNDIERAIEKSLEVVTTKEKDELKTSRGMLFVGPPGTGKTLTGKIMMDNTDASFIWVSCNDVRKFWDSMDAFALAFKLARNCAPSVLFLEDIDGSLHQGVHDLLKTELDGLQENRGLLTILTTNHPEQLPDALLDRPGRFHEILNFSLPDSSVRTRMILTSVPNINTKKLELIVQQTQGFSGAHMKELLDYAVVIAEDEGLDIADALVLGIEKLQKQKELINTIRNNKKSINNVLDIIHKEGRVLSKKNRDIIREAKEALEQVLKISNEENADDEADNVTTVPKGKRYTSEQSLIKTLQNIVSLSNETLRQRKDR